MEGHHLLRRILHSMAWIVLVYYFIPDPFFGYSKRLWVLLVLTFVLVFEALRIYFGFHVYGMRHYEKRQIAAYAWAGMAAAITLLFFPMHLAVLCLVGMGLVDPMIGEIQELKPKLYPYVPLVTWIGLALIILIFLTDFSLLNIAVLSSVGGVVAIIAEYPKLVVDDDFLMIVVPLFVLRGIELILT